MTDGIPDDEIEGREDAKRPVERLVSLPSPVAEAFGLSYASWFLVPRVVLEAMPYEWQKRFVAVMKELDATFDWETGCPTLAVFQVDDDGDNPEIPPQHLIDYCRPDIKWLESIKTI